MANSSDLRRHHLATWQDMDTKDGSPNEHVNEQSANTILNPMSVEWPEMAFLNPHEIVAGNVVSYMTTSKRPHSIDGPCRWNRDVLSGCVRANACRKIWWDPSKVTAAIVTCGGLCPGLNSVIRGITKCLWNEYKVQNIFGITSGFNGLSHPEEHDYIRLTPAYVEDIHMKGGSVIKAARGGFDAAKICETLKEKKINMLFLVGGDGTQFAGNLLYEEAWKRNLPISIVGLPKSIDNDIPFFDKTFGFDSAVAAAADVIRNAWVEASSCHNGVGIVKLMGRDSGYVAMHAATASDVVDLCMIPEVRINMPAVFAHVDDVIAKKGYMVIAVAEGAGQELVATNKKDGTGHKIYGDIGVYIKDALNLHLKTKGGRCFYIDPSYIIRSVPINPNDHIYCVRLANDAVHTAMRGYTGVCVGALHNIIVILPSKLLGSVCKRQVRLHSSSWQGCVQTCCMPRALSGLNTEDAFAENDQ